MTKIGIIVGSTRPGRNAEAVARWVYESAAQRTDAEFEIVDLLDYKLPLLDEATPAGYGNYSQPHTKAWAEKIASLDGFVIVTGEYNRSMPAALKNAIDFVYAEWNNKAVGFVSYGSAGGARAVEHLRGIAGEMQLADVRSQVTLSLFTDFENFAAFKPADSHREALVTTLDQVVAWSKALAPLRAS
ncbi:NADPH-dependent FMN reductase [Streptomyces fuscichromogenes]|uniref:NADPH-dependent FMN reductase n=1 Tax=Streptomyces fuscichromogenes TaxID=1324013 RepID=UPI0037F64ACE